MPKHIAFFNIPVFGHTYPTLDVVAELVRRGHRVSYVSVDSRRSALSAMGATVVPYRTTTADDTTPAPLRLPERSAYVSMAVLHFIGEARATLAQVEPHFQADPPDVVVHDRLAFGGLVLAAKYGIPAAQTWPVMMPTHWSMREELGVFDEDGPGYQGLCDGVAAFLGEHGVPMDLGEFLMPTQPHIAFYPRAFQHESERFGDRYHFVGPCIGPRPFEQRWKRPDDGRPIVMVTLGTLFNMRPDFYRTCFTAFADSPWHVVMAVGERFDLSELGTVPDNVEVHRVVSQLDVLAHASVLVSHAGLGGLMESLREGMPQVVVPHTPEQELNARRVVDLGLGRWLATLTPTAARLREAVDHVAGDTRVTDAVMAMRQAIADAGGTRVAADVIESCGD